MPEYTANYKLQKQQENEFVNINGLNENFDIIDATLSKISKLEKAGGTATAITLENITEESGFLKTFLVSNNNNGAETTINGKPIYKPGTTSSPILTEGKAATIWFDENGDCFFIKASAEGNAVAANVLAERTFSNSDDTGIVGSMENQGAVIIKPEACNIAIPKGFHNGEGYVLGDTELTSNNIRKGVNLFGVEGSLDPMSSILGVTKAYYAYAGDTISTGDFVKFVTGVAGVGAGEAEERQILPEFESGCFPVLAATALSSTEVLLCYMESVLTGHLKLVVLTIDGVEFSIGTSYTTAIWGSISCVYLVKLSNTSVALVYLITNKIYSAVMNLSGTNVVSEGSRQRIYPNDEFAVYSLSIAPIDSERFVLYGMRTISEIQSIYFTVCTVGGSNTEGFTTQICSNSTYYYHSISFTPDGLTGVCLYSNDLGGTYVERYVITGTTVTKTHSINLNKSAASINSCALFTLNSYQAILITNENVGDGYKNYYRGIYFEPDNVKSVLVSPALLMEEENYGSIYGCVVEENKMLIQYTKSGLYNKIFARIVTIDREVPTAYTASQRNSNVCNLIKLEGTKVLAFGAGASSSAAFGIVLNAPGTEVECLNYLYETQVAKSTSNDDINGIALDAAVGGISIGANASHNQITRVISKL
ncbi:hypothetical protein SAMN05661086_01713 [Anaeromicropila populeti]|uniref:Uncharacterized protein n=2 Tax=Anaeromicropila populeti TaxID=37658 RepID=A0A1I6JID2_9FIRM|nr:hypothetical protein SAMN05661086_01713 [Anaeromicropila populeti]